MTETIIEKIDANHYYIKDLFSDKFLFEIPIFQRPFSWEVDNFHQLFDDINDSLQNNELKHGTKIIDYEPYFLGAIILATEGIKDDKSGKFSVIDGQQRLISLAILMATIRDITKNNETRDTMQEYIYQKANKIKGTPESIRIMIREKEKDFFEKFVLMDDGTSDLSLIEKDVKRNAENNIKDAISIYQSCFYNKDIKDFDLELVEKFSAYLSQKVVLVVVKTHTLSSAFRLFNVINTRGMKLTNADLLKSINFGKMTESKHEKYRRIWEDIEETMEEEGGLDILIRFIRNIKIKQKARENIYDEYKKLIFKKEPDFLGENFIKYLEKVWKVYQDKIIDAKINTGKTENDVRYSNLISLMRDFLPFNDWMSALIIYCIKYNDEKFILEFLIKIERKIIVDWVYGLSFTQRLTQIYRIIVLIEKNSNPIDVINDPLFNKEIIENKKSFDNKIDESNIYRRAHGGIAKYLLLGLDLRERDQDNVIILYKGKISVEHILPQNPIDLYWLDRFSEDARKDWTHSLGNLILLNSIKNSKAGRKPFPQKIKDYINIKKGDFFITDQITKLSNWNLKELEKRHIYLVKRASEIWVGSK